jgi:hypothetical protein
MLKLKCFSFSDPVHILNCEYTGPPKSASQEQFQLLRELCPHLVPEVRFIYDYRRTNWQKMDYTLLVLISLRVHRSFFSSERVPSRAVLQSLATERNEEKFCSTKKSARQGVSA